MCAHHLEVAAAVCQYHTFCRQVCVTCFVEIKACVDCHLAPVLKDFKSHFHVLLVGHIDLAVVMFATAKLRLSLIRLLEIILIYLCQNVKSRHPFE